MLAFLGHHSVARANESHKTSPREFGVPENEERIFGAMK